jgi:glutamate dehydrogenase/leucine dehydrogenase
MSMLHETAAIPWADNLGPAKVLFLHDSYCGLNGVVVIDNLARGPAIGGVRMVADVTPHEVFRLARAMTLKNAAAGLPHGGGKAGIAADPNSRNREQIIRSFARGIAELRDYIPGPDMGTDEATMVIIHEEIARAVGLPRSHGGIPIDEIGATGFGLAECAEVAAEFLKLDLKGARVSVEGFGHVGEHAARFLARKGAVLVAASDTQGLVYDPKGIDLQALVSAKGQAGSVLAYDRGKKLPKEEIFSLSCDIFIPAARPDTLDASRAARLDARLVLQGANIPATPEAEKILYEREILVIPDFIANAGGVICCTVEYHGGNESTAFTVIREKIRKNTEGLLRRLVRDKLPPREAAMRLAMDRLREAMSYRDSAFLWKKAKSLARQRQEGADPTQIETT